jgi:uncharacterized protein (UPF0212 family)
MTEEQFEYTYEDDDFKCPYCGEYISDSWEVAKEGDSVEIECACGKKFLGELVVNRSYKATADCEINKEEHKWEDINMGCLKCSICGAIKIK